MELFSCQEIGSLSKPRWLVAAPKRGRATEAEVENAVHWGKLLGVEGYEKLIEVLKGGDLKSRKAELRDWACVYGLRFLEAAGLDLVYDGEQRRVEMYEYPIRRMQGFRFLGNVRSFDNKYYLKASCMERVRFKEAYHLYEFEFVKERALKNIKVPLTGPYTLADWSFNEHYQRLHGGVSDLRRRKLEAKRDLVLDLAEQVIRPNIQALQKAGAEVIQIDEPAATTHPEEVDIFVEGFNAATKGIRSKLTAHICYSDYRLLYPEVLEMRRCSQFAWEFANRDDSFGDGYTPLELFEEYNDGREVGLGVVDVHVSRVEKPEEVRDRILRAAKILQDADRIYVNPDCGLRTRTWKVAFQKLRNMVEGASLARKVYEGA
ncbi:MAG: hypothetical protein ACE5HJ_03340 [Thermoplasmata archaeon]